MGEWPRHRQVRRVEGRLGWEVEVISEVGEGERMGLVMLADLDLHAVDEEVGASVVDLYHKENGGGVRDFLMVLLVVVGEDEGLVEVGVEVGVEDIEETIGMLDDTRKGSD